MGINKIKLKQIDADFSGLVGQYGSGYFPSIASFNTLSGQSVKYSDLSNINFVYATGNQNISGVKNFLARPTFSGETLAKLSEVVTLDGDETINGLKDFSSDVIFHGNVSHELGDISFIQNSFSFNDSLSLTNFRDAVSTELITTKTSQIITGVKNFTNGISINGSGVLYSGQINPIYVSEVSSNLERYAIFAEGTGSGFKFAQMQTGFSYNPSTKILKASTFSGNLSGLASGAINASSVYTSGNQSLNVQMYPAFVAGTGSGFQILSVDSRLIYNPSENALSALTFSGNLSGLASGANNASLANNSSGVYTSGNQSLNAQMYPSFVAGTGSGFQILSVNSGLSYNPNTEVLRARIFSGNLSGSISGSLDTTTNGTRYLLFTTTNTNGYKDIGFSNITTNPSTNSIAASTFVGSFSGNSLNSTSSTPLNIGTFTSTDSINFNFPAGTSSYTMTSGAFFPSITGRTLGNSTNRWGSVWAVNSAIQTSDRNLKTEISEIPDSWLDAWQDVNYVKYKFKDAVALKGISGARWHLGHIAQDIYEAFDRRGLDAFEIGMLCYDSWGESVDQNGNIVPSGEIWSIRPDECQFMELALMRRSMNRLKSGILI
jgi:hypothetical protein